MFSRFPRNTDVRDKWTVATKRDDFTPSDYSRLCSEHFTPDAYQIRPNASHPLLKHDAIPRIFNFPSPLAVPPKKTRTVVFNHEVGFSLNSKSCSSK